MKANFDAIINDTKPVLVDFHATWCSPCKEQHPILKDLAQTLTDKVKIIQIDVEQNPEIANKYEIMGVPTLLIFKNGIMKYRQSGVHSKAQLMDILLNKI